jgi:capsular exopolysaccharide synthesis family protein
LFDLRDTIRPSDRSIGTCTFSDLADRRLVVHPDADRVFLEQYRHLGAALHHAQLHQGVRAVAVASAIQGEGKTLSATNLALMLSRSFSKRVLLVDGDLRKPSIHELLRIDNGSGLSDMLKGQGGLLTAQAVSPTLSVITGGCPDPDPVALLTSDAAAQFLSESCRQFDWVIVDTPPVVLFPDAELLAGRLDACVLVVGAATTTSPLAAQAVAAIGAARILGVVLNRAEPTEVAAGYGYGRYGYAASDSARDGFGRRRSNGQ